MRRTKLGQTAYVTAEGEAFARLSEAVANVRRRRASPTTPNKAVAKARRRKANHQARISRRKNR